MYYGRVQGLAQRVTEFVRRQELLRPGDRVGVAVSGGADSVALLRLLLELRGELGIVLSVVHFNHKLRGDEAETDEQFVEELARRHKLSFHCESGDVKAHAAEKHLSVEAAARELRYQYFQRLLEQGGLNRVATAHTIDDQAETVLMRMARGSGTRGLAGIYPQLSVSRQSAVGRRRQQPVLEGPSIIRPLLGTRRKDLEAYLVTLGQDWREDASNRDLRHTRNRVRHGILPRLERHLNPAVREALAEAAEIARAEEEYWEREVSLVLPEVWPGRRPDSQRDAGATLDLAALAKLPLALQRRVVRAAGTALGLRLEFRHVEEVLQLAASRTGGPKSGALPDDWRVVRGKRELRFEPAHSGAKANADYEYPLPIPGEIPVPETGSRFEAVMVPAGGGAGYNPEHLLDRALLAKELHVRNWRAGDRFWPAHSKAPKKIKELLQERQVSGLEREFWPVVVSGAELVWVRGFAAPEQFRPRGTAKPALAIRETKL